MRAHTNSLRRGAAAVAVGSVGLAFAPTAGADPSGTEASFFQGGAGSVKWSGGGRDKAVALDVPDVDSYAGVVLDGAPATLPSTEPSFEFVSTVSGGSGGSPRLVIQYSDGTTSSLRPLTWTAGTSTTVTGALWEDNSGCPEGSYNLTYAQVQTCRGGDTVEAVYVVSDSGWLHPEGYTHYVDDITYGDIVVSEPAHGKK